MKKYFFIILILISSFSLAFADSENDDAASEFFNILQRIFNLLFWALMIASVFFVMMAAYQFLSADGDPNNAIKARKNIYYAIAAIVLAVLAATSSSIIIDTLDQADLLDW